LSWPAIFGGGLILVSWLGVAYTLLAAREVRKFARRRLPQAPARPAVTILKPLCGAEPGLYENLRSFCEQGTQEDLQVIFGVREAPDPAVPIVRRLMEEFPNRDLTLVMDDRVHGTNFKVSNLLNMLKAARHDILVIADSDVRVGPGYLETVVGPLADPAVGLVTCLYAGRPKPGLWSRLGAMFINHGFVPSVLVGEWMGVRVGCYGVTMAIHRKTLSAVGGLARFRDLLADDHALGAAIRRHGKQVALSPYVVDMVVSEPSMRSLLNHEIRWLRTVRAAEPLGYAGMVIVYPIALAVLALPLVGWSWPAWATLAAALVCRMVLVAQADRTLHLRRTAMGWVVLRDLLSFGLYLAGFLGKGVVWRQHQFRTQPGGVLALDGE
jgi:ceramide glucosyltransferase